MFSIEVILFSIGMLLLISVLLSKVSGYANVPTLIVFLFIGLLLDSNAVVKPSITSFTIIQYVSIFALITIMFSGGLDTDYKKMKPIAKMGLSLATVGVLITAFVTGLFIHFVIGIDLILSLLVGSIISSTDVAAVFSIFRSDDIKLKPTLTRILELESASNDPMAYILTTSFLYLILNPSTSILGIIFTLIYSLVFGTLFGLGFGKISSILIKKINLSISGLYPVLLLAIAVLTFAFSEMLGGNGFLSVYIAAVLIGNNEIPSKVSQLSFFDGIAWLMQIIMFIVLGLFAFPNQLIKTAGVSLLIATAITLISRPLAVFITLHPFNIKIRDKIFLSWTGIKGAVPIVFATYPLVAGIPQAPLIFNIVFFITIISVILQGSTINLLANKLNLLNDDC